jgi:hypothetical protein
MSHMAILRQLSEIPCVQEPPSDRRGGEEDASVKHQPKPAWPTQGPIFVSDKCWYQRKNQNEHNVNGAGQQRESEWHELESKAHVVSFHLWRFINSYPKALLFVGNTDSALLYNL